MKTKFLSLFAIFFLVIGAFSQSNLNNYKYVIVPAKYDFLKDKDQYQLNSLTAFLFNKYGFQTIMEGANYPEELIKNRCLALKSDLIKDSSMFKTKLSIELKDCYDQVIYTSEIGESREKEYNKAYNEALRAAFNSIEALSYKYEPLANTTKEPVVQETKIDSGLTNEIEQLREEIQSLKKEKELVNSEKIEPVITPVTKEVVKDTMVEKTETTLKAPDSDILYAQAIENGFQLVDSSPKVVYKIRKTSIVDVYLVEGKNATVYKRGADWIIEYYENNVLKQDVLNIKF
jgi:hypothetical protein